MLGTINDRIKWLRKSHQKKSLREFGDCIGMSESGVSMMENGKRAVTEQTIQLICAKFGIRRKWLEDGEGDPEEATQSVDDLIARLGIGDNRVLKALVYTWLQLSKPQQDDVCNLVDRFTEMLRYDMDNPHVIDAINDRINQNLLNSAAEKFKEKSEKRATSSPSEATDDAV